MYQPRFQRARDDASVGKDWEPLHYAILRCDNEQRLLRALEAKSGVTRVLVIPFKATIHHEVASPQQLVPVAHLGYVEPVTCLRVVILAAQQPLEKRRVQTTHAAL